MVKVIYRIVKREAVEKTVTKVKPVAARAGGIAIITLFCVNETSCSVRARGILTVDI